MKTLSIQTVKRVTLLTGILASTLVISACATGPAPPQGADQVRTKLTMLQQNPALANNVRNEIRDADAAVRIAEQPLKGSEAELGQHRVYMAHRSVAIAEARATTRLAEEQRQGLGEQRDAARLDARTREADLARDETTRARSEASVQAAEYQRQIDALEAEVTDRGVVLTLGDVLFATGSAELQSGAHSNLNRLVSFLGQYPDRQVQIEGHTDNVGAAAFNQALSQRRADSVRSYLTRQGIASQRLSTSGLGFDQPIASNANAGGRQQNRRVEIIIDNPQ